MAASKPVEVLSVEELLRQLSGSKAWTLAIAQRPFEWDKVRVSNLVDSLLRGFPIGSLLVVRRKGAFYQLEGARGGRTVRKSPVARTQILDGQQRCQALRATFGGDGFVDRKTGKRLQLWINLQTENPRLREFDREHGARYLAHWGSDGQDVNAYSTIERRREGLTRTPQVGWIQLSQLRTRVLAGDDPRSLAYHAGIDTPDDTALSLIRGLSAQLRRALEEARIPVHLLDDKGQDEDGIDLFHVFVRINTGGLPLSRADEYLAGLKKYWPEVEQDLGPLAEAAPEVDQRLLIEVLARCAARTLEHGAFDPHPLDLAQLSRPGAPVLVKKMRDLARKRGSGSLVPAVQAVADAARGWFFHGARHLPGPVWMAAVAWVYAHGLEHGRVNLARDGAPLRAFLFWTSLLGSAGTGRSRFSRDVFSAAWRAGDDGAAFPYADEAFLRSCFGHDRIRAKLPEDARPGDFERGGPSVERIRRLLREGRVLVLAVFQRADLGHAEPDHLLPYEVGRQLFRRGHSYHWEYANLLSDVGNLALIDATANRVLCDAGLDKKLALSGAHPQERENTYRDRGFIKTDPALDADELNQLRKLHKAAQARDVPTAGPLFKAFVARRNRRVWEHIIECVGPPPTPPAPEPEPVRA